MTREAKEADTSGLRALLALVGLLAVCGVALFFYQRTLSYPSGFGPASGPQPQPAAAGEDEEAVEVGLQTDGTILYNGETKTLTELKTALLASHPLGQAIKLSAPPAATHGEVKAVMDALTEVGFWNLSLGVSK